MRFRLGEYEQADEYAARAFALSDPGALPEGLPALRMRARMGAFQIAQHEEDEAWLDDLRATFRVSREVRRAVPEDGELAAISAGFIDWLGMPDVAVARMQVELEAFPEEVSLHKQLIDIHVREGVDEQLPPLYAEWVKTSGSPTVVWYAGYVARLNGDLLQREREFERARGTYAKCIQLMADAADREASYRDSAEVIAHQARLSVIWCHLEEKDFDTAEKEILDLLANVPERREEPDGLGRSLMNACAAIGQRWVELSQFQRAARVSEAVVAAVPEDGEWWNNLGFLLREYGTQMENGAFPDVEDNAAQAKEIFRRSWKAYRRAAELKPEDARVINDGALVQVYHVQEELELAEEILRRSIAIGEAQLAAMGPEPDEAERFPVAQAVGGRLPEPGLPLLPPARQAAGIARVLGGLDGDGQRRPFHVPALPRPHRRQGRPGPAARRHLRRGAAGEPPPRTPTSPGRARSTRRATPRCRRTARWSCTTAAKPWAWPSPSWTPSPAASASPSARATRSWSSPTASATTSWTASATGRSSSAPSGARSPAPTTCAPSRSSPAGSARPGARTRASPRRACGPRTPAPKP